MTAQDMNCNDGLCLLLTALSICTARASIAQSSLTIEPDTLFYSAEEEIRFINAGQDDVTLQRLVLSTVNPHEWFFLLVAGGVSDFVELNALEYPAQQINVVLSPADTAFLRVVGFDPCIVCGNKRRTLVATDALVLYSTAASSPDTVLLDASVYLPVDETELWTDTNLLPVQVYPNPAWSTLFARLVLNEHVDLQIVLFDVVGRRVRVFARSLAGPGEHLAEVDVHGVANGTYFVRLELEGTDRKPTFVTIPISISQ